MSDQMIDLMAGDELLRRRLLAYADLRLSPDLTTSSRLRARVMAVAHRHASLARADAGLVLLPRPDGMSGDGQSDDLGVAARAARRPSGARSGRRQRAAAVVLAASLGAAMFAGGVYAARPGGPLYETRLWAETLALPSDPSAHALADLDRLRERLREIGEASRSGDTPGLMAALAAYESIVEEASAAAILSADDVAAAVLETGVARNVEVLRALAAKLPTTAAAITRAVDAAIARSTDAVERINASRPSRGPDDGNGGGPANPPPATKAPTAEPTPEPAEATPKPRPTHKTATPKPTPTPTATPSPRRTPDRTPKPRTNQSEAGPPATMEPQPDSDAQNEDD